MLEKKTTVTDGLRIASSALDVICTSFINPSVKHLKRPENEFIDLVAIKSFKNTYFWCERLTS